MRMARVPHALDRLRPATGRLPLPSYTWDRAARFIYHTNARIQSTHESEIKDVSSNSA